jgi:hypothetical protein
MAIVSNIIDRVASYLGYVRAASGDVVRYEVRDSLYQINEMLYTGSIYQTNHNGGALERVLTTYFGDAYCNVNKYRIKPFLMPFKEIVETYQHVLPGTWGDGVSIADKVNGKPIADAIREPLAKLWASSNLDTEKSKIIRWAANFGTVGLRVTSNAANGLKPARVAINADHPSRLFNFEEDAEGNVTAVCLKYTLPINYGTLAEPSWEMVEVVETIDKAEFSRTYNAKEQLDDAQRANTLGFCPYVVLRHKDNGTPYGDWAYRGSEETVHALNWRITRQDKSIDRHQFPKWFGAAGGAAPITDVDMGDEAMTYVQTMPGTPPPILQAIVPQVNQTAAQAFWTELRDMLRGRQPELNLNDVKLLGNTSGEALAQILKPTEKVIGDARPAYWHAFTRAMQMGLSAGVQVNAWDLGTGSDADAAYRTGVEDFTFAPVPLLPATAQQLLVQAQASTAEAKAKLQNAQAGAAIGLPRNELWRIAGYSDQDIPKLTGEVRDQSTLPAEVGGATFPADTNAAA